MSVAKFFIGGLAPQTTEDDLRRHFEQFGELVDVAVMKDAFGIPRCFGFVQYSDPNGHACVPTDDHVICGKKVDCKAAVPKEAIDQGAAIRTKKIFVGGLSKASTADTVTAHFSQFGTVTEVLMKFDEFGQSRGFCFVEFDTEDAAELACATVPMTVDDKQVECKLARPLGDRTLGKGKGFGKGFGKGGPMRTDFFGKGMRPSPYGIPTLRGGFGAPAAAFGRGGYSRGAVPFSGKGASFGAAGGYGAVASPVAAYGSYSAAPAGYSASPTYAAAPAYGAAAGYGAASYAAPAAAGAAYGSYGGYA